MSTVVDFESLDLSACRCDLSGMTAEEAARTFYAWGLQLAKHMGVSGPVLHPPNTHQEFEEHWAVIWEDFPFVQWASTGGGWTSGPLAGWKSMRSGAHYATPELGPFFRTPHAAMLDKDAQTWAPGRFFTTPNDAEWYADTHWGCDLVFIEYDATYMEYKRSGLSYAEFCARMDGGTV